MTPDQVRHFKSSVSGFGFRIVAFTHRLDVITRDGKRHKFFEEKAFLKFVGDLIEEQLFSEAANNNQ